MRPTLLQVSFRDLIPDENIVRIAKDGHSQLLAQAEPLSSAVCLSISVQRLHAARVPEGALRQCGTDEEPRFRVVLQLLHGEDALLTVKASASRAETALRNGLAVAAGWVPLAPRREAHTQPSPSA